MLITSNKIVKACTKTGLFLILLLVTALFIPGARADAAIQTNESESSADHDCTAHATYDKPPEVVGGFAELQKHLIYPENAKKAKIEGRTVIELALNKNGEIKKTKVIQSMGNAGCDSAAVQAIKNVKWRPAYMRDKPVPATVSIPIVFKLK